MINGYFRRVIKIVAEDSPNVAYARAEEAAGLKPSGKVIIEGVLPWHDYTKRRATWDPIRQAVGLDAVFYRGAELLLFPPQWRALGEQEWARLQAARTPRKAKGVGVDTAEGGDRTALCAVDEYGVIEIRSFKTPDTNLIPTMVSAFVTRHGCPWDRVVFDRGGGGQQHADRMREDPSKKGIRTVGFGQSISVELRRGMRLFTERQEVDEARQVYASRRAQLYGTLSELMHPDSARRFAMPPPSYSDEAERLHRSLAVFPRWYDHEDRLILPPKNRKPGQKKAGDGVRPLVEMIGFSPDESDALVLAIEGMLGQPVRATATAL